MNRTSTHRSVAAALALSALALTGCGQADTAAPDFPDFPWSAEEGADVIATPTHTRAPDPLTTCTVDISDDDQDRATVACGALDPITVGGDFRDLVVNDYDAEAASGVRQIIVVGGQARVWMTTGQGDDGLPTTCLIAYSEGLDPVECESTDSDEQDVDPSRQSPPLEPSEAASPVQGA